MKASTSNIVVNFNSEEQDSARLLLELLMVVDGGRPCRYFLQYGSRIDTLTVGNTVLKFLSAKDSVLSTDLPAINIPAQMVHDDPNLQDYEGNQAKRSREQKFKILQWNLCLYKYIYLLDSFLMIEPDCVILKNGWLDDIHQASMGYSGPIWGHLKKGRIRNEMVPTHWAGCSLYNCTELRKLPLEYYFSHRYENPWWRYRNDEGTTTANNCFYGPVVSGYDISYDYFLFCLYWKQKTGVNDPFEWPLDSQEDRSDIILCDFHSRMGAEEIYGRYANKLPVLHGIKSDEIREKMLKHFHRSAVSGSIHGTQTEERLPGDSPESGRVAYPLSCPLYSPHKNNDKLLEISDLKNRFAGERCFIIGNGPSLKATNLRLLRNEYTIGLNRIYLNYDTMGYQPTFHCSVNLNVLEQFAHEIDELDSIKFLHRSSEEFIKNKWNTFFMESRGVHDFVEDLERLQWCEGWTVTYCAMQVAFYLGFRTVILVGVDHHFVQSGEPNKLVVAAEADHNHFHPDYFGKGVKWQYPDLERSEKSYAVAKRVYEEHGRIIIDATVGGKLQIFPKMDYLTAVAFPDLREYAFSLTQDGEKLVGMNYGKEAGEVFQKALQLAPDLASAHANLAFLLYREGAVREGLFHLKKAAELEPGNRDILLNGARVLINTGASKDLKALFLSYLAHSPEDGEITDLLMRVLRLKQ